MHIDTFWQLNGFETSISNRITVIFSQLFRRSGPNRANGIVQLIIHHFKIRQGGLYWQQLSCRKEFTHILSLEWHGRLKRYTFKIVYKVYCIPLIKWGFGLHRYFRLDVACWSHTKNVTVFGKNISNFHLNFSNKQVCILFICSSFIDIVHPNCQDSLKPL